MRDSARTPTGATDWRGQPERGDQREEWVKPGDRIIAEAGVVQYASAECDSCGFGASGTRVESLLIQIEK